ncbi:MAG: PKD domain-containing protein [Candidatus Bathyarchaeia archaeon]
MKKRVQFLFSILALTGLILLLLLTTSRAEYKLPIVWSDKREYNPSETAYLFGYGFMPFTQINLTIVRPDSVVDMMQTSTDEFGYFSCPYVLDGIHGVYNVTASDGVNVATTSFENSLYLHVRWDSHDSIYIYAKAGGLRKDKYYYIKYFDPAGIEKRQSPTYTGVHSFEDNLTILPTFPNIFGWWIVKLYENDVLERTKSVYIDRIVWTTDSTYTNLKTSFAQGETVYFKTMGLKTSKYYRFKLELPNGTWIYVGDWTTGVTEMTGSYPLPLNAPLGTWKLHVREADDAYGTCEHHYVDCRFEVTTPPPPQQYYLTVRTDPPNIGVIPGEGWYNACTLVNLTAPEYFPGPTGIRYRFNYWDVDGVQYGTGVYEISVLMDANHTATAHYITQYFLNLTTNPPGVTIPAGMGWYDTGTNASIFAPEFVGIEPNASRYRFANWTTDDMSEITDPTSASTTVVMDKAKTVTANYIKQYKVEFNQTGLDNTAVNTVLTVNGSAKTYTAIPYNLWVDEGGIITYSYEAIVSSTASGKRFTLINVSGPASPITVTTNITVTGNYKIQYQVTVTANPPQAIGGTFKVTYIQCGTTYTNIEKMTPWTEWVDADTTVTVRTPQDVINVSPGTRYKFDYYDPSSSVFMDNTKTVTLVYKLQYYLTVSSPYGIVGGEGWYDSGATAHATLNTGVVDHGNGTRRVFKSWGGNASGTNYALSDPIVMDAPKTAIANWKTQYLLTVLTDPAGLTPQPTRNPEGEAGPANNWWYDTDTSVTLTAQTVAGYNFNYWDVNGASQGTGVNPITVVMGAPKTATAHYTAQVITYTLIIETTAGGTTNPAPGTYTYAAGSLVQVTAIPSSGYVFDYWELNGTNVGTATTYTVTMNNNYVLKAFFKTTPAPPTVSISPMTASILVGQQVTFTSTVSGGTPPYTYQWYLNGAPVSGATSPTWTFMPTTAGIYYVQLKVTDANNNVAESNIARITVSSVPVGGYSIPLARQDPTSTRLTVAYTTLIILFGAMISLTKRRRK